MGFSLLLGPMTFSVGNATAPKPAAPVRGVALDRTVTVTAYNAVPGQTDETPFETASGAYSNPEVVAARSQDFAKELPFGTIIELDGSTITSEGTCGYGVVAPLIGYRVIEDTMNARYTSRVDILFDTKADYKSADGGARNAAEVLGICKGVTVRVVGHVDINHIPKTQVELARLVNGSAKALALK